jgi:hypothetical protein
MMLTNVHIQSLADVAAGKPLIENLDATLAQPTHTADFGILEGGCQSGATSVMLVLRDTNGRGLIFECSAQHFETMAGAVRGAVARFGK